MFIQCAPPPRVRPTKCGLASHLSLSSNRTHCVSAGQREIFLLQLANPTRVHRILLFLTTASQYIAKMGRVRTKTVKKSAKVIIERYYPKLSLDFEVNKRICDEIAIIAVRPASERRARRPY